MVVNLKLFLIIFIVDLTEYHIKKNEIGTVGSEEIKLIPIESGCITVSKKDINN